MIMLDLEQVILFLALGFCFGYVLATILNRSKSVKSISEPTPTPVWNPSEGASKGNVFCPRCGKETDETGMFCQWCGECIEGMSTKGTGLRR